MGGVFYDDPDIYERLSIVFTNGEKFFNSTLKNVSGQDMYVPDDPACANNISCTMVVGYCETYQSYT